MEFNKETFIAVIRLVVSLVLAASAALGYALDADFVYNIIVSIAAFGSFVYIWWKNNNVTDASQTAQILLNELKDEEDIENENETE